MDGNGRWAMSNGNDRAKGHLEGIRAAKRCVMSALNYGIKYLSLYTFSTENWRRSDDEIVFLFNAIAHYLRQEADFYHKHKIRILHSGSIEHLPQNVINEIEWTQEYTKRYDTLTVNLAINYGGRDEIVRAFNRWSIDNNAHAQITEQDIRNNLDIPHIPDPDLIIRTGGEYRLSNFLLWESAYAELYFSDTLWPDWDNENFVKAIDVYAHRRRNFGGVRFSLNA